MITAVSDGRVTLPSVRRIVRANVCSIVFAPMEAMLVLPDCWQPRMLRTVRGRRVVRLLPSHWQTLRDVQTLRGRWLMREFGRMGVPAAAATRATGGSTAANRPASTTAIYAAAVTTSCVAARAAAAAATALPSTTAAHSASSSTAVTASAATAFSSAAAVPSTDFNTLPLLRLLRVRATRRALSFQRRANRADTKSD